MAVDQMRFRITGTFPLLMHSARGVNTRDPLVLQKKAITKKRDKTDEDQDAVDRIDWELGLYYDPAIGPYLPQEMILATIREAAKKSKQGKLVVEAVWMEEQRIKLEYDGPRTIDGLFEDRRFFDIRTVVIQRQRINRARPTFPVGWSAEFTLLYDAEFLNEGDLVHIVETAGRRIGIGDYRPTYGRFEAVVKSSKKGVAA